VEKIKLFLKGFAVGIGGVSPGLSGSILMVALGLYRKVIDNFATIYKDFKTKISFLLPIFGGMLIGVVIFSRIISYMLVTYEFQTRLTFFGLLLGAIPLVYREVKKNGDVGKRHYIIIATSFAVFFSVFTVGISIAPLGELSITGSFAFGLMAVTATIIPGIEAASFLSTFGLYGHWLELTSLRNLTPQHLIPTLAGFIIGGILLSKLMSFLFKKDYTTTFAVLFGFFLSIIPNVLKTGSGGFVAFEADITTYVGIVLFFVGFAVAFLFGRMVK
jgi:putative membrane protein